MSQEFKKGAVIAAGVMTGLLAVAIVFGLVSGGLKKV